MEILNFQILDVSFRSTGFEIARQLCSVKDAASIFNDCHLQPVQQRIFCVQLFYKNETSFTVALKKNSHKLGLNEAPI